MIKGFREDKPADGGFSRLISRDSPAVAVQKAPHPGYRFHGEHPHMLGHILFEERQSKGERLNPTIYNSGAGLWRPAVSPTGGPQSEGHTRRTLRHDGPPLTPSSYL